jgi:hypothetical protein
MALRTSASSCMLVWDALPPTVQISVLENLSGQFAGYGDQAPSFLRDSPCTEYRSRYRRF